MIVKKIFYIFIFFPSFHIFSFRENVEELEVSKEDSQEIFYENNKKEFNIKGHLSISSGALNCITLSGPLYRFIQPVLSFLVTCKWEFGNCGYKETCIFNEAIKKGYTWKGIPYQVFFWLFSCSLRYDYFFNKTIGFGVKFDIFGDHIKQPLSRASKEENVENSNHLFIDDGTVPEKKKKKIRKENPTHLIIVDACLMDSNPGDMKIVDKDEFANIGISTHSMSLSFFVRYLEKDTEIRIIFVGIEPETMDWGVKPTPNVEKSADEFIETLKGIIV